MTIYGMTEEEWLEFEPETTELEDIEMEDTELLEEMNYISDMRRGNW